MGSQLFCLSAWPLRRQSLLSMLLLSLMRLDTPMLLLSLMLLDTPMQLATIPMLPLLPLLLPPLSPMLVLMSILMPMLPMLREASSMPREYGNLNYGYTNINSAKQEVGNTYGGVTGG